MARYLVSPRTLAFILNGDDVLLLKRSPTRRILPGQYNGLGGHVEPDETVEQSVRREIAEESGLTALTDLRLRAIVNVPETAETGVLLFVFTATTPTRAVTPSPEGDLVWVPRDRIAALPLVADLRVLLPAIFTTSGLIFGRLAQLADGTRRLELTGP